MNQFKGVFRLYNLDRSIGEIKVLFLILICNKFSTFSLINQDAGKLCDWLTPANDQECGEAGDYVIYHSEEIPVYEGVSSYVLEAVTVHFVIGDEDECSIRGYFSKAYSMMNEYYHDASTTFDHYFHDASSMMGFSMMALASLALTGCCLCRKKKSDRARAAGTATDDEAPYRIVLLVFDENTADLIGSIRGDQRLDTVSIFLLTVFTLNIHQPRSHKDTM